MTSVADRDNPSTRLDEATVLELIAENGSDPTAAIAAAIASHAAASDPHPGYDTAAEVSTAIGVHAAAGDPHPVYLTQAEGDALYAAIGGGGGAFAGAKVYASAHQVLTDTAFSFDSEEWDTDGYHEPVTHPTRITIPAGRAGKYLLVAGTFCTGTTRLEFHINGSPNAVRSTGGTISIAGYTDLTAVVDLAVGDYVEVLGNAGGARTYGDDTEIGAKTSFAATLMSGVAGPAGADGVSPTTIAAHGARVKRTANQSVGNNTMTAIAFTAEDFDTDAIHDNVTNNSRLTIPAVAGVTTGLWSIKAFGYTDQATGDMQLKVNGTTPIAFTRSGNPSDIGAPAISADWVFTTGDYVELYVRTPAAGGNILFDAGVSPILSIAFLGKVT